MKRPNLNSKNRTAEKTLMKRVTKRKVNPPENPSRTYNKTSTTQTLLEHSIHSGD